MNIKEFNNIMSTDDIQSAHESYQDMLDANESVIESFENLLKEYENTETRINENYYNSDIKEAVNEKADKVKKCTSKIVDKLKNQKAYLKRKIHSKTKKSKKEYAKLEEFKDKAKDVDFNESTITLKRYNSGRQTESFISTMESTITKMNKLAESYYNTNDKRYLDKFDKTHNEYKELFKEACEYLNTTSEVRLDSTLVESAINTLISENSNTLELRKEYDNLMGKLQTKARYNGKVLESFSDANAAQMSVYPAMIDTYQFKISKLNSDVANAKKIIEAAAQFDDNLYEDYLDLIDNDDDLIEEGANLNLLKDIRSCKKEFKTHIKAAKKAIKAKDNSTAKKEIKEAQKVIDKTEKIIKSFDNESTSTKVYGSILGIVIILAKNIHWLLLSYAGGFGLGYGMTNKKWSAAKRIATSVAGGATAIFSIIKSSESGNKRLEAMKKEISARDIDDTMVNTNLGNCVQELHNMKKNLQKLSDALKDSKNESAWLSF